MASRLLKNGDFEGGLYTSTTGGITNYAVPVGWTPNDFFVQHPSENAVLSYGGSYALEMGNSDPSLVPSSGQITAAVSQTISDIPGTIYVVSFHADGAGEVMGNWDGGGTAAWAQGFPYTDWTITFIGTGSDTITIAAYGTDHLFVDDISVSPLIPTFTDEVRNSNGALTLTGMAESNSSVAIFDRSTQVGVTTADANGSWSFTTAKLSNSVHDFWLISTHEHATRSNYGDLGATEAGLGHAYYGTNGNDTIVGTDAAMAKFGPAGLTGGNDLLIGGVGADKLTGGSGNDTFIFKNIADSQPGGNKFDTITDFVHNSDKIDFSAISGLNDSVQTVAINIINGNAPASIGAHTIDVVVSGGNTTIYTNASGSSETINNHHEDMVISLIGVTNVSSSDFLLHL